MGDLSRTVDIIFNGVDDVSASMDIIGRNTKKFGNDLASIGSPFADIATNVFKLDAALAALVVGGLGLCVSKFASFEDKMLAVKGVMGASAEEYELLTDAAKKLGSTTKFTADQVAEGFQFLGQSGMNAATAMKVLPEVLNLAAASAVDLGTASDIVTNIMAGYGIAAADIAGTTDVLTATFTNSNTSLEQLGQAFKMVGPVAKSLGFEIEETSAALGILGNAGYQAEMGGTALRNIMLALVAPAGNMGKLMKELGVDTEELGVDFSSSKNALDSLGVTIKDSSGNILPFKNILGQLKTGLEQIPDPADRTATLIEIFGKRGGPQMAALLEQGVEAIGGLETKIGTLGGITEKIADEMESGMGGAFRALVSAFDGVSIEIGEKTAAAIKPGVLGVTEVLQAVTEVVGSDTFKPIFDAISKFSIDMQADLKDVAKNIPEAFEGVDFDGLISAFDEFGDVFGDIFGDIDLTSVDGLETAIQTIVDGFESLVSISTGIADVLIEVGGKIFDFASKLSSLDSDDWALAGKIIGIGTAITGLGTVIAASGAIISGVGTLAGMFSLSGPLATGITATIALLTGPAGLIITLGALAVAITKMSFSADRAEHEAEMKRLEEHGKAISVLAEQIKELPAEASTVEIFAKMEVGDFIGAQKLIDELTAEEKIAKVKTEADIAETEKFLESWDTLSEEKTAQITAAINNGEFDKVQDIINGIESEEKTVKVTAKAETEEATETMSVWISGFKGSYEVKVPVVSTELDKVKKDIDAIPTKKMLEIKLQGEIDKELAGIQTNAENLQSAMEWTAKLKIAEAESSAKILEAAFDSIGESVVSLSASTSSMFGSLMDNWTDLSNVDQSIFTGMVDEQQELTKKALDSQIKLTDAQTEYLNKKSEALTSGNALIQIDTTGVEPAIEMVLWEIIDKVQIRATENAADFLLGA